MKFSQPVEDFRPVNTDSGPMSASIQERAEPFHVLYDDLPGIHIQQALRLKPHQVARNQLAYRAKLISQFLVARRKLKFHTPVRLLSFALREPDQGRNQTLANRRERQLLNNPYESS